MWEASFFLSEFSPPIDCFCVSFLLLVLLSLLLLLILHSLRPLALVRCSAEVSPWLVNSYLSLEAFNQRPRRTERDRENNGERSKKSWRIRGTLVSSNQVCFLSMTAPHPSFFLVAVGSRSRLCRSQGVFLGEEESLASIFLFRRGRCGRRRLCNRFNVGLDFTAVYGVDCLCAEEYKA